MIRRRRSRVGAGTQRHSAWAIRVSLQIACTLALVSVADRLWAAEDDAINWDAVGQEAARLLADYIRVDTQNPPGDTTQAVEFLEPMLRQSGLETQRFAAAPNKPILIGRLRGQGKLKPIVLLNHMDVVPADPKDWAFPPLAGDIVDGMVRGRGAIDMKGLGILQLLAARLLAQHHDRQQRDIVFLAVPDEEVGGTMGTRWLAQQHPDVLEADGVWDEGGYGIAAGALPSPVLLISVTEKKVLWIRLVATGPSGHGSRPLADAAPMRLLRALDRIFSNPPQPHLTRLSSRMLAKIGPLVPGVPGFAMRNAHNPFVWLFARRLLDQDPLISALLRDTMSLTMLEAGYKPNVIPEQASAVLDCRLLPDRNQERFLAELTRVIDDHSISIEVIQDTEPAAYSSTNRPLYKAMEASAKMVYPDAVISPFMTSVGTDSRFFRRAGVPAYGLLPALLSRDLLSSVHGVNEQIPVATLGPAVRVIYETLRQM